MKKFVSLLLALCVCLGCLCCAVADEGKVDLRFMWWGSQTRHDRTIAAINLYMEQNPNVSISYEFMGFDDYFTKLNTLVASNDVPDVFQIGNNFLTYESVIEPLDSYIENGLIDVSNTNDSYLSTTRIKGKQLGLSLGVNTMSMVYDPAMFEAAGVAEPTANWTWEDLENASNAIHEKLGVYGSSKFGSDFYIGLALRLPQYETGETVYNEEGNAFGYTDDSHLAEYFAMKKRMLDAGSYPAPGVLASITDPENDLIVSGQAAIAWLYSNQLVALLNATDRELKITTPPRKTADGISGLCIRSGQAISMYNGSAHKEEAAKFIDWFLNSIDANLILNGERGIPIMSQVRDAVKANCNPETDKALIDSYDYIDLAGSVASNPPPLEAAIQIEIENILADYDERVLYGVMSPEDAATEFRYEVEDAFARIAE